MRINGEETNILRSYRSNDAEGRLSIMLNNYAAFPKIICKAEKKIQYKIKSDEVDKGLLKGIKDASV